MRLLPAICLLLASCASIVTGPVDDVTVDSVPQGAYFTTNLGDVGQTPKVITVPAAKDLEVTYVATTQHLIHITKGPFSQYLDDANTTVLRLAGAAC